MAGQRPSSPAVATNPARLHLSLLRDFQRVVELDPERLLYESTNPVRAGAGPLLLTPLELLEHLAVQVTPQRIHRHRHFGVLARTAGRGKFPRRF